VLIDRAFGWFLATWTLTQPSAKFRFAENTPAHRMFVEQLCSSPIIRTSQHGVGTGLRVVITLRANLLGIVKICL